MTSVFSGVPHRFRVPLLMTLLSGAIALPAQGPAADAPDDRILVMPFAVEVDAGAPGAEGAALWLGEAASVLLTDGLAARGVLALPREERSLAFNRLQLPMSSALTRATMIRVGELLGASGIVFGEVRLGEQLTVRARLVDLTSASEPPPVEDSSDLRGLFPLFDRVADQVARHTGQPLAPEPVATPPLPLEVFESYIKGLVASTPVVQQRFLEAAMVGAPSDGRILTALWSVYSMLGQHDRALEAASAVPSESPLVRSARFAVALSLIELERFDGAFRELATLHAQLPAAGLSNAMGVTALRRASDAEDATSAITYFAEAVEAEPYNTDYLFNLGYSYALAGNSERALYWLRETVRHDATSAEAHLVMSVVLVSVGRLPEAQRERELAVLLGVDAAGGTRSATVPHGLEHLPSVIHVDGVPVMAAAAAPSGQHDQQVTAAYHLEHGRRHADARRDREAIEELRRAIYLAPYEDEPHLLLGMVYQRGGRLAEAIDEFKVAIWSRETVASRVALGAALLEAGDREGARQEAVRALELDPRSVEARELLDRSGG